MQEVKVFIRGWIGYFRVTDMKRMLMSWDEWMRRRLRMYIWKQWKKPRTKVANLRKLGIPADRAYQWGNSRLGYRRIAGSPVLKCSITNERLAAAGYFSILSYYESLHSCGWTAVYRSIRTVVWEVGSLFGKASYSISDFRTILAAYHLQHRCTALLRILQCRTINCQFPMLVWTNHCCIFG